MDTIRLLLQAKIDTKQSIPIINEQIKAMTNQLSKLKLQVKIDDKDLGNIQNINKKAEQSFDDVFKSSKQYNDELHNLIHAYKTQQIAAQNFVETASKYRQEQEFSQLSEKQQIQLVNTLQRAEKEHVGTLKETLNVRRKIANEQARMQEQVKSFQLKMLGTDKIPGEMDTFAQKQKGKFDPEGLAYLRKEVELLGNLPLEQQASRVKELNIEWGLFTKTAQQSGNVLARTFENMYKFMRFYIVGGIIVRVIGSIRNSIGFIKELDKELTQVSIVQGLTKNQTLELAKSYATLALEMGKTVTEISKVNTELVRQGLSMEESQNRLNTILRLSATAGIDTSQSMRIITSSVNALGEESERTADIMLKAANISASNVEQIGSAFTKVASSAKATGISITELNAIISTLVEVTQEDPRSLGTSLNTLLSRFNRINEETGELNQNFNDVHRAFTSVGISFLDAEGQIRPVYELLHDLSGIWDSLDRNTKMYISTQAAGTRQQNRFLAIMDNFNRVMEINEELMDSAGTLSESYSIYLNSVEASANRTKASLEQMWINAINSEAIKMFYDVSTAMIKLIDRVGLLNTALFALIFIASLATRQFSGLRTALVGFSTYVATAITEMGILKGVLFSLKTAFDVVGASAIAAQIAMSAGLSLVITALSSWIAKLINRTQELKNANAELVQSYKRNVEENRNDIKRLKELGYEYENIRSKLVNHIELNEEERRTLDEIIAINPTLLQGYDDRGRAIVDTTESIDDMIESLERANEIEDARLALGGEDLFKEARNGIAKTQRDIDKLVNKIDDLQHGRAIRTSIGIVARDRLMGLDYLERQYDHLKQTLGENAQETQKVAQQITEKRMALKNLETQLSTYQQTLKTQSVEVKNALFAHTRLTDSYKKLSGELRNFVADYIRSIDILDFEDFIEMQVAVDNLIESLRSNEGKQFINQYAKLKSQLDENAISTKKFNEEIKKLINNIKDKELKNAITHFFSASKEQSSATKELMTLDKQLDNIRQTYVGAVDTIEEYNKTLQDLNESKELNYKALLNLAEAHPRLLLYMNDRKKLIEEITRLRDEEVVKTKQSAEAQIKIVHDQLLREVNLYLKTSSLKKNIYETDFQNYKSLGEAKLALEQRLQEKIIEMNNARLYAESLTGYDKAEAQRMYVELHKQVEYAKSLLRDVDIGLELEGIEVDFSKLGVDPKKEKSPYESQLDALREYQIAIQVLESEIKRYQSYADLATSEQNRIEYLNKINSLTKEHQEALHKLNNELRYERNILGQRISKEFSGVVTFDVETGTLERNINAYNKLSDKRKKVLDSAIKDIDKYNDAIKGYGLKWWDDKRDIQENAFKIISYHAGKAKDEVSELDYELNRSNAILQKLNENSKEYRNEQNRQIVLLGQKRDVYEQLLQYYQQELQSQDLTIEHRKELSNEVLSLRQSLLDIDSETFSIQKAQEDTFKRLIDESESELKSIKKSMEDLNKQHALEQLQNDIRESELLLEPFANELDLLKTKLDILPEADYEGRADIISQQFKASQKYGRELRNEFNRLSKTTTDNSQETDALIASLTNLQQKIKQNTLDTIEYQKALDNLRIDQIVNEFSDVNKALERELNLVNHNLKMLEGGLLSGTDIVFGVDFALPTIPKDLIDKKRRENEKLLKEQSKYEKDIADLQKLSLKQQRQEQKNHYNETMSELVGHYYKIIDRIKEYHGIELDEQKEHQYNVNEEILDGLNTTAENYNSVWSNIVSNLRVYLSEIEQMVDETNAKIRSVGASIASGSSGRSSSSGGSGGTKIDGYYAIGTEKGRDVYSSGAGGKFTDGAVVRDDGLIQKGDKVLKPKFLAKGIRNHDGEKALVGEEGEELGILPNGKTVILGRNGAELVDIPKGTQVIPHKETKEILSYTGDIDGEHIPKYKSGTKGYITERELRERDDYLTRIMLRKYGYPIIMIDGSIYKEHDQEKGKFEYAGSVYDEKYDRDDKIRILFGDMLKSKYPDSTYLDNHNKMMDYIATEIPENASIRQKATGITHMGSYDESLPKDFQQYREERTAIVEQIQKDQQKIIEDIAKGLDVSELKEDVLNRINEQLQKDVEMQFRLQEDTLRQQIENAYEYMRELEDKYLEAIDDENLYMANKLAEQYNEAADTYLRTQEKLKNAIKDRYEYEFSLIDKKINKETEVQDIYRKQLEILKESDKHNYDGFIQYNKAILQSENNKLALLQQSSKELQSQLNLLEVGSYEWNLVNDRLNSVNSSIQDTTLSIIKQNKEVLKQKYERELYNVEKDLFGGQTLDEARKELNDKIKYQNEYVGGLEKELMVSKIISDARKNNVELTKSELALLNQSGNIEKVKLERLEKQLNVRMLEQKLSNIQNQKNIQQLIKKDDGTWDFAYVADQNAIYNAERDLKEAKLDLIKWERDLDNRKRQEELDAKSQYLDELRRLTERSLQAEYQSLSEFYTDANKITSEFYNEVGSSVHSTIDALAGDFNSFLEALDNFKSTVESYDIPENSILGIVGDGSVVQQANDIINELLQIQDKALEGQYNSFNEFIDDIQSLGDKLNDIYSLVWDSVVEKQLSSNDTLKMAYEDLLFYYETYAFMMSKNTDGLTDIIVNSSLIIEESINFMTEMVQQMVIEAEKASFSALESAETAAQAMISAIESARGASQAASDAAKSASEAAYSASNIADKMQTNQSSGLNRIQSFDSGGYTGDFKNGKLAVLHEKELVLNKIDTQNLLKAVNVTRDLFSNIKIPMIPKMQPAMADTGGGNQIFHISKLEFPGVRDAKEIEQSIKSLSTYANQWANRK